MNSLMKLLTYSDSESDSEQENNVGGEVRLPLPGFIGSGSNKEVPLQEVNVEGKIRNFPHEPGNWATYIYIPVESFEFSSYASDVLDVFKPLDLKLVEDFHISLTKTFILRHHWIPDFITSLKICLKDITSFKIHLFGLKAYINEQNTRTFLSLKVNEGTESLISVVSALSDCFRDYNLEGFYEDPSFHISLLWCPGNKLKEINKYIDVLPETLKNFEFHQNVSNCVCATGNKRFTFNF